MPANSGGTYMTVSALPGTGTGIATVTFARRFEAVVVTNTALTSATNAQLYVRADGTAPTVGASQVNDEYIVQPGQSVVVRNGAPIWYQGQGANPGTTVQIAGYSATSNTPFTVQGV